MANGKTHYASGAEIFAEFGKLISELRLEENFKSSTIESIQSETKIKKTTISRKKKVKMIQMYEPKIELPGSRQESRKARELKNLKKEVKSKFSLLQERPWLLNLLQIRSYEPKG